jgi:hypothetical protein
VDKWKVDKEYRPSGYPWDVTVTFANRDDRLVVTRVVVAERDGSPSNGITAARFRGLALGSLVDQFRRSLLERHTVVEPSERRHRLPDKYLRQLVARRWMLDQEGEPAPRKRLAEEFGRTPTQIRDHLTAARRRGLLVERLPDELPKWLLGLAITEKDGSVTVYVEPATARATAPTPETNKEAP